MQQLTASLDATVMVKCCAVHVIDQRHATRCTEWTLTPGRDEMAKKTAISQARFFWGKAWASSGGLVPNI